MSEDDRHRGAFYLPGGLTPFKEPLFRNIASCFEMIVRQPSTSLLEIPDDIIPVVSCRAGIGRLIDVWEKTGRPFVYWDRGYAVRYGVTWLKRSTGQGYLRWTLNATQMNKVLDRPDDRWRHLGIHLSPWKTGRHIVVAAASPQYEQFHGIEGWADRIVAEIRRHSDRPVRVRPKMSRVPLDEDLRDAHCLVTHASIAAVEAVIMGCPVVVDPKSAASPVGRTDVSDIESPVYPDREPWAHSLAYSQFTEEEILAGTMWREIMRD